MALTNLQKQTNRITKIKTLEQVRAYWNGKSNPLRAKDAPECRTPGVTEDYFERQYHTWRLRGAPCPFEALIPVIRYDEADQLVDIVLCSVGYFDFDENSISVETYNALNIGYEAIKLKEKDDELEASIAVSREMLSEMGATLMKHLKELRNGNRLSPSALGDFNDNKYAKSVADMQRLLDRLRNINKFPDSIPTPEPAFTPIVTPESEMTALRDAISEILVQRHDGTYTAADVLAKVLTEEKTPRVHIRKELWRRFKAFFGHAYPQGRS